MSYQGQQPQPCPNCGSSRQARYAYGFLHVSEVEDELDAGTLRLGGCVITEDSPEWHCNDCGKDWSDGSIRRSFEREEAENERKKVLEDREAIARGVMDAKLRPDGWTRCPHCGSSFSTQSAMSWDGEKHNSCRTRLRLIPASLSEGTDVRR